MSDQVKLAEDLRDLKLKKIGVRPDKIFYALDNPDKTDELDFQGSCIRIHTKRFDALRPSTLLIIESVQEDERIVSSVFRVYPELSRSLEELRPLGVLQVIADSFGLLIRGGNQVGKLILRESFSAPSGADLNLLQGLETPRGSFAPEVFFKIEDGPLRTAHCALAFAIDTDLYSGWLNSVARRVH
jgi:hypothetical protein